MKIAFLIKNFYPYRGGAENNCYFLARHLSKQHEIHIFCSSEYDQEEFFEGIHIHRCKRIFEVSYYTAIYPTLFKKLCKCEFDIVHVHGIGFVQHDFAIYFMKRKYPNTKVVCTPHGPFMPTGKNFFGIVFKKIYTLFIRYFLKNYNLIIQVNPNQYNWLVKDYSISRDNINFLPNGIPDNIFLESSQIYTSQIIKKYNLENKFVISYVGRIQEYKGLDQVINALPALLNKEKNLFFVVIGRDMGDQKRLQNLANDLKVASNIVFLGEVEEVEKINLLNISQIFVFPSQWEAFGIAILEAMACKNLILSTKTEGGNYLIEPDKNGYLYDFGDVQGLIGFFELILSNQYKLNQIQLNNSIKAKDFLWSDIALRLEKFYKNLFILPDKS